MYIYICIYIYTHIEGLYSVVVHKVCILMPNSLPMMLHCSQSEDVDTSAAKLNNDPV